MRPAGPAPSIASLFESWLSLTGWVFSACYQRASSLAENSGDRALDAVMDLGCPPTRISPDADELPPLDASAFAAALQSNAELTLHQAAEVLNADPHGCLEAVTRDRVLALFRDLAEQAIALSLEQRIAAAEGRRGEADASPWVSKYRRMLAADGKWPPAEDGLAGAAASSAIDHEERADGETQTAT